MKCSPMNATRETLRRMRRDNFSTPTAWIMTDGDNATIAKQRAGEDCEQLVTIPIKTMNALIRWYIKEQTLETKKPRAIRPVAAGRRHAK